MRRGPTDVPVDEDDEAGNVWQEQQNGEDEQHDLERR